MHRHFQRMFTLAIAGSHAAAADRLSLTLGPEALP